MMRFILAADLHHQASVPACRPESPDEWLQAQENVLKQIADEANKRTCPVIITGDIFESPHQPSTIIEMLIRFGLSVQHGVGILAGNHDLPWHNWDKAGKSSIALLWMLAEQEQCGFHPLDEWGRWRHFDHLERGNELSGVRMEHRLVFRDHAQKPSMVDAPIAADILDEYPESNLILLGDMHHRFVYSENGRHVINPGTPMRHTADLRDYTPGFYYIEWNVADQELVTAEFIESVDAARPIQTQYLQDARDRDERKSAFVEALNQGDVEFLDFESNVNQSIVAIPLDVAAMVNDIMAVAKEKMK